ncbi:MAG: T9SS type A sorting domain-containing protein [Bacteroidetes bacterium]|nr:T9SS type A sorting domain-containing protein [Bacteroidota bacterium]
MKQFIKMLIAFCLFAFGTTMQAQNTIPASGGNATGSGGSVSYSIGQIIYTTNTGLNGSVTHGIQHPFEISVVTSIEEVNGILLEIVLYPNPASNFIKLIIENYEVGNFRYQLYDINGNILLDNKVEGNETNIVISNLVSATYFLKLTDRKKVIKTFKIVKI